MPTVNDAPERSRYELVDDAGEVLGHVRYRHNGDVLDLLHTEIDDGHEGEGLGGTLARGVLDDARGRGLRIRPTCPFIAGWIEKHPDYADLVTR
jgi:hypothetical protein